MKNDPCWKNYEMIGNKEKDGKTVPNCVKKTKFKEWMEEKYKEDHITMSNSKMLDKETMIKKQLETIERSIKLLDDMKAPAWVQAKINLAGGNVSEAAWQTKEGKNKNGGLNEKGRKSYEKENPGSDLKAPSKKVGNPRRKAFCARMKGMKNKLTSSKTASDPDSRINKSLRAWNC